MSSAIIARRIPVEGIIGTSRQGYITCTRRTLEAIFGEPNGELVDDKVPVEWYIEFVDDQGARLAVATIYAWKVSIHALAPDALFHWHIGGFDEKAVELVHRFVGAY